MLITGTTRPTGRRRLLQGAAVGAAALVTGCQSAERGGSAARGPSGPSREERLRRQARTDAEELLRRYDATIAAHPALAARLTPLRAEAAAHVAALGERGKGGKGGTQDAKGSASPSPSPTPPAAPVVPAEPGEARTELAAAARRAAEAHARTLADAPGELARLLASVSAAGTVHAYLLSKGAAG
ncbi:hypothetical protein AB0M28_13930 [Streptomyces sp. NPDC051940]|uniref:hypothetical protein n=1 Tax=Streptomyces sp. NPDC051940 TaxID=3155675 RepID=UPI0034138F60